MQALIFACELYSTVLELEDWCGGGREALEKMDDIGSVKARCNIVTEKGRRDWSCK